MDYFKEILCLYPYSLLSNKVLMRTSVTHELILYQYLDLFSDDYILNKMLFHYRNDSEFVAQIQRIIDLQKEAKKLFQGKRKDKSDLIAIGKRKALMNKFRKMFKESLAYGLNEVKLLALQQFASSDLWDLNAAISNIGEPEDKEDLYIQELTKTITEYEYHLAFADVVEELFSFSIYDTPGNDDVEFIKIPLLDFPMFDGLSYLQMEYTWYDIRMPLEPFLLQLCNFANELFQKSFQPNNLLEIKQLCIDNITEHIKPAQQVIDNSLYLSQLRNKTQAGKGITFCMGITSVENLIEYYSRCEMILPYVASQIKQQVGREMDLKASCIFVYCTF